jgi:hypothetical protein
VLTNLRPRGVGEILDAAVALYRARFGTLMRVTALIVLPVQLLNVLITLSSTPSDATANASTVFSPRDSIWVPLAGNLVITVIALLSNALAVAAVTRVIADAYLDAGPTTAGASARFAMRRGGSVLGLALLVNVLVLVGGLMCGIPGIWLQVSLAVAMPALLLERLRIGQALNRSFALVKHRFWPCFAVHYLGALLTFVVSSSIAGGLALGMRSRVHGGVAIATVGGVTGAVTSLLTTPFLACAVVVLYFDLRIRKEGFDVQMAVHRLDTAHA